VVHTETKTGKPKIEYLDSSGAQAKAQEYLGGAKTAADVAGRCLALVVMALYADEDAVANSNRSCHDVSVSSGWRGDAGLPWADEVVELIDELAIERLPDHLTASRRASLEDRRTAREERATERERQRQERDDARTRVQALPDDLSALSHSDLSQAVVDARTAYGTWSKEATGLDQRVREVLDAEEPVENAGAGAAAKEVAETPQGGVAAAA
jgi:hypothetical protein